MCGIFGIVTNSNQLLGNTLVNAGRALSYRGYDSVGCATLCNGQPVDLRKDVGKVDEVAYKHDFFSMQGSRGIIQLRWATFGHPSPENAQPHLDSDGDLVGAHNGNVVNNVELRQLFIAEGLTVRSENDGESCVHAVERHLDRGLDFISAIRGAFQDLAGDYAFVIGQRNEERLYAIKKGSGLVVGIGAGFTCVSSDLPSILPLTRQIVRIYDGEIVTLHPDRIELHRVSDGVPIERAPETVTESMESVQKGGYPHFMLKEIHEQPVVAAELLHLLAESRQVDAFIDRLQSARNLYLIGCGTSYHACLLGAVYFAQLANRAAIPVLAPQFIAQYGPSLGPDDVGIYVSQSGETKDVINAIETAQLHQMNVLGLVNVIGSTLTQVSSLYLPLACGYEISVPATKTFTNQAIAFLYLAYKLGGHDLSVMSGLPGLLSDTIEQTIGPIKKIAAEIDAWDDLYCLGYGLTYPIALEGALKLKEITYAHCEGMLSTEFKHGPLSAVHEGYPVIFTGVESDIDILVSGINEVTCRGGRAVAIGPEDARLRANADHLIALPTAPTTLSALAAVIPLQLLSYEISLLRGFDPDFPRNLSKTLTVD